MLTRLVLFFAAALVSSHGYSQDEAQLKNALREGKAALSQPEKIPAAAQKIQDFFSNPKSKALFETPEAKELANLQHRLTSFIKLADTLGSTSCNIDRTKQSGLALEILTTTLATPQCSETAPEFFQEHKKVSSLIEEKSIVEEGWYTGQYAISDEGRLVFPWELSAQDLEKYNWKSTLEEITFDRRGELKETHNPDGIRMEPSTKEFVDELYRQSLVDTFKTYMYLQTVYGSPKVNIPALVEKFCTKTKTFKKDYECPKGMETFLAREANQALKDSKPKSHDSATKELNGKIVKLNALRAKLDKNTTYLPKSGIGKLLTPRWVDEAKAKQDYAEYAKIYREMISSGPGLFVATDELSHDLRMKDFSPMSFSLTPKTYPTINTKRFKEAVEEAQELTFDHAQELLTIYHKKKPAEEKLKNILKLNPAAVSSVLLNRPEFADKTCDAVKKISIDEMNDKQLRLVTTWGGTIVGGALILSGIGAGVGASMVGLGTAGAVAMVPEMIVSYDQLQKVSNERDAAIAAQNGEKAQEKAVEYKQEKTNFTALTVLSGAAILADVHMGMRVTRLGGASVQETRATTSSVKEIIKDQELAIAVQASDPERLETVREALLTKKSLDANLKSISQETKDFLKKPWTDVEPNLAEGVSLKSRFEKTANAYKGKIAELRKLEEELTMAPQSDPKTLEALKKELSLEKVELFEISQNLERLASRETFSNAIRDLRLGVRSIDDQFDASFFELMKKRSSGTPVTLSELKAAREPFKKFKEIIQKAEQEINGLPPSEERWQALNALAEIKNKYVSDLIAKQSALTDRVVEDVIMKTLTKGQPSELNEVTVANFRKNVESSLGDLDEINKLSLEEIEVFGGSSAYGRSHRAEVGTEVAWRMSRELENKINQMPASPLKDKLTQEIQAVSQDLKNRSWEVFNKQNSAISSSIPDDQRLLATSLDNFETYRGQSDEIYRSYKQSLSQDPVNLKELETRYVEASKNHHGMMQEYDRIKRILVNDGHKLTPQAVQEWEKKSAAIKELLTKESYRLGDLDSKALNLLGL